MENKSLKIIRLPDKFLIVGYWSGWVKAKPTHYFDHPIIHKHRFFVDLVNRNLFKGAHPSNFSDKGWLKKNELALTDRGL